MWRKFGNRLRGYVIRFRLLPIWLLKSVVVIGLVMGGCFVSAWGASLSAQEVSTHVVQPGETLSAIARRYDVSVNALARQNGITLYRTLAFLG
jgi:hypothetical protein